jgi:hypothetical protein
MKLRAALGLMGFGVGAIAFAAGEGCGGNEEKTTGGVGKSPPAAEGAATASTGERVFALNAILLGEADRSGIKNKDAWKKFGYDLDGRITTATDGNSPDLANVCKRAPGARAVIHQDGEQGTDNAFGKEVLPLLDLALPSPSRTITDSIKAGTFTILLKVVGLDDDPAQTNKGLSGTILVGGVYGSPAAPGSAPIPPNFDSTTDWPFVNDTQVSISGAYITKGMFVNGEQSATVRLALKIGGQTLDLNVRKAIISFKHDPVRKELAEGTIAGVLNTEEFVKSISSAASSFNQSFCDGLTLKNIQDAIRQSSDMLADGSQDPSKSCDGISVGIGFTGKQVATPTKEAVPVPAPPDPCTAPRDGGASD